MRRYRILLLTHEQNIPPDNIDGLSEKEIEPFVTEFNVYETLCNLGHHVRVIGWVTDCRICARQYGNGDRTPYSICSRNFPVSRLTTSTSWRISK